MNDDGTMARRPDLESFAKQHGLKIGTIADLIRYRLKQERSVERIAERQGADRVRRVHVDGLRGPRASRRAPGAGARHARCGHAAAGARASHRHAVGPRGHSRSGRTWTFRDAMQRIAEVGTGIVIVLRDHSTPRELADAVSALGQHLGHAAPAHAAPQVLRTYGIGAQILKDLGVTRMQVLSTPKQLQGISAFGLEITGLRG
jgi:3,4-dihydroxy 2-butanone 4-phosphate synthase/GTP cyclohydrolase II